MSQEAKEAGEGTADAAEPAPVAQAPSFSFNKPRNRSNLRKRPVEEDAPVEDTKTTLIRKAKQAKDDNLTFTTRKEQKLEVAVEYEASRAVTSQRDTGATRVLETETQFDRDGRALREQVLKQGVDGAKDDGKYRGMNSYTDFRAGFRREHTVAAEKGTGAHGPLRANVYVRSISRFDYQPDICKDYKETGFCSYGDSCKFLHDRGDYKSGWEQEREWAAEQKAKRDAAMLKEINGDDDEEAGPSGQAEDDDSVPFGCFLCRRNWAECETDPVVTRCQHYFCQACALKHNLKTGKCAVCQTATQGIFNIANNVMKKLKKSKG